MHRTPGKRTHGPRIAPPSQRDKATKTRSREPRVYRHQEKLAKASRDINKRGEVERAERRKEGLRAPAHCIPHGTTGRSRARAGRALEAQSRGGKSLCLCASSPESQRTYDVCLFIPCTFHLQFCCRRECPATWRPGTSRSGRAGKWGVTMMSKKIQHKHDIYHKT